MSTAEAVGEDLEVRDGIGDVLKGRIQVEGMAEVFPLGPMGSGGLGVRRNNAMGDVRLCKAEVAEEIIAGCKGYSRQGRF